MKIAFSYDIGKDAENFIKSAQSANNPKPTKLQEIYIAEQGENLDPAKVKSFLKKYVQENKIDVNMAVSEIDKKWQYVEHEFIRRTENVFGRYPADIHAYLSTNSRCTYNIEQNYFFVFVTSKNPNALIMHELLHFYTWRRLHDELIKKGISSEKYNNIKESLTELLNLEYKDLMEGYEDKGYSQHKKMRELVREIWAQNKDLDHLITELIAD